jgi:hypothetical protein
MISSLSNQRSEAVRLRTIHQTTLRVGRYGVTVTLSKEKGIMVIPKPNRTTYAQTTQGRENVQNLNKSLTRDKVLLFGAGLEEKN